MTEIDTGITLAHPGRLWVLVVVAALAGVLVVRGLRRGREPFADAALLPSVAPRRAGRLRLLVPAALLLATTSLSVAWAQPQRDATEERERATIVIALDTSSSMLATDVSPDRFSVATAAAKEFIEALPEDIEVGLVIFNKGTRLVAAPTDDHASVAAELDDLNLFGGTALGDAILTSLAAMSRTGNEDANAARIVLIADGGSTEGSPVEIGIQAAVDAGVPVTTIAYGTADGVVESQGRQVAVPVDPVVLQQIADATGGKAYQAATGDQLTEVYADIGTDVVQERVTEDLASRFAGVAGLLLVLTAVPSLLFSSRLL
ncbi:MAG: VWA domain-containing protein [Mycobacteriales bacterium]|nr:VWA domain-containing protein [Mycobacteriales bacterium]